MILNCTVDTHGATTRTRTRECRALGRRDDDLTTITGCAVEASCLHGRTILLVLVVPVEITVKRGKACNLAFMCTAALRTLGLTQQLVHLSLVAWRHAMHARPQDIPSSVAVAESDCLAKVAAAAAAVAAAAIEAVAVAAAAASFPPSVADPRPRTPSF